MGLNEVSETLVGDSMHKGISGGQLKRLSIAVEIIALPALIFLDEVSFHILYYVYSLIY
jgi:ABC-type multidrug transport system ATPase subunit